MSNGWTVAVTVGLICLGLLFWWMWYNGLMTAPRIGRHVRAGVGVARATPAVPDWLRNWLLRALVVFLILAIMAGINYLSELLFGFSIGEWIDDLLGRAGAKTLAKTLWQPLPLLLIATGVVVLALIFRHRRIAAVIVVITLGLTVYHYLVPTKCWSKDMICIATQEREAATKAAEEFRKEQDRQAVIAAAMRPNTASGFMPALGRMVVEYRPECVRTVIESYPFQSEYASFPGGRCSTTFTYPAGACVMYKTSEHGPEEGPYGDCQGSKSPSIPADPTFARSIGAPFSVKLTVDQPVVTRTFQQ